MAWPESRLHTVAAEGFVMPDFRQLLTQPGAQLFDGAIGTLLYQKGAFINVCYDELNLTRPDLVRSVHQEYRDAGARLFETNTFGANRIKLNAFGLADRLVEINRSGVRLAREAIGDQGYVIGSIGPLGARIQPLGTISPQDAQAIFQEQADALSSANPDAIILETFSDLDEIAVAIDGVRAATTLPVIAQMTVQADRRTILGADIPQIVARLELLDVDVIGLNCSVGPHELLEAIQEMAQLTQRPLSAQPNAGLPREVQGRTMYMASPDYMAKYARRLVLAGARFVGGCCGTGPEHIKAMAAVMRALAPGRPIEKAPVTIEPAHGSTIEPAGLLAIPLANRSQFARKLASHELVISVELLPPQGIDLTQVLNNAQKLKAAGVDAINIPDGPRAMMRMGVLATSQLIEHSVEIETIPHYCCRDRNLLGMMGDLLGASAVGIRNLLIITGDPPKMGPYPDSTAVFDIDSVGLTSLVSRLNHGLDLAGNRLGSQTSFLIGVGVNPCAIDIAHEIDRFRKKVEAGAEFAITQPIFDVDQFLSFLDNLKPITIPIIAAIWPLVSYRNAEFLNNEVPGVRIPAVILDRMKVANERGKEAAREEGVAIAQEMLKALVDRVAGFQVSAPFGKADYALPVLEAIKSPAQVTI